MYSAGAPKHRGNGGCGMESGGHSARVGVAFSGDVVVTLATGSARCSTRRRQLLSGAAASGAMRRARSGAEPASLGMWATFSSEGTHWMNRVTLVRMSIAARDRTARHIPGLEERNLAADKSKATKSGKDAPEWLRELRATVDRATYHKQPT